MASLVEKGKWYDLKETSRVYTFRADGSKLTVIGVNKFLCSRSGNHYLETMGGTKYIVASGWLYIEIKGSSAFITPSKEEVSK